jgi:hypothetical protein
VVEKTPGLAEPALFDCPAVGEGDLARFGSIYASAGERNRSSRGQVFACANGGTKARAMPHRYSFRPEAVRCVENAPA